MKDSIGIDISKDTLDAHRLATGESQQFANTPAGLRALRRWIAAAPPGLVVYEATGPYHRAFERAFAAACPLVKVNPLQARRFAQARGTRAKTDTGRSGEVGTGSPPRRPGFISDKRAGAKPDATFARALVDARMLAAMGTALDLAPDPPAEQNRHALKELQIARMALIKDRTRLLNRLKTQTLPVTKRQTRARLDQIKRQLAELEGEMRTLVRQCPRLGEVTAITILIKYPEIGSLTRKQIASLAGLAPMARQSGQWRGKAFIQGGRKHLRDALDMPALVAARFNPDLRQKYQSMTSAGKPAKLALTALMRKLLELANALIRQDRAWLPRKA